MNAKLPDRQILENAGAALAPLGIKLDARPALSSKTFDAEVRLIYNAVPHRYHADIKRHLRPSVVGAIKLQQAKVGRGYLLVADYVSPPIADRLRSEGIPFIDASGNAYLQDDNLLIWVSGRPDTRFESARASGGSRQALVKVTFALLSKPELVNAPLREIAAASGVALGTVHIALRQMVLAGDLVELDRQRRLVNADRLAERWAQEYVLYLRPKTLLGTFSSAKPSWWMSVDPREFRGVWSGDIAAWRLESHLVPQTPVLFAPEIRPKLVSVGQLRPDPNGETEIRKKFWNFETDSQPPDVAPPLLVYADLLANGDSRSLDAARRIYDNHVRRSFNKHRP